MHTRFCLCRRIAIHEEMDIMISTLTSLQPLAAPWTWNGKTITDIRTVNGELAYIFYNHRFIQITFYSYRPLRPIDDQQLPYPTPMDPVFKVEEWCILKKSKDRINSLRRLDRASSLRVQDSGNGANDAGVHPLSSAGANGSGIIGTPSIVSCGSYASSSHISTPEDSLEWDIDQDRQLKSENESLDLETKELLLEIEQLKNRVLNETGANLNDLKYDESIS